MKENKVGKKVEHPGLRVCVCVCVCVCKVYVPQMTLLRLIMTYGTHTAARKQVL
jgi:hypothetical protein